LERIGHSLEWLAFSLPSRCFEPALSYVDSSPCQDHLSSVGYVVFKVKEAALHMTPDALWLQENGYELLFLSARAISQADLTRQFLFNVKQDGETLPNGPVVISPDGLFPSLYREGLLTFPSVFLCGFML
jgi:hypothetical protein